MIFTTSNWKTTMFRGVLSLILGGLLLAWPAAGLGALGIALGLFLILAASISLLGAWSYEGAGWGLRSLATLEGLLGLAAGVVCLAFPGMAVIALVALVAFWLLVDGVLSMRFAWKGPSRDWPLMLLGLLGIAVAVAMVTMPLVGVMTVLVAASVWFLVTGVLLVALSLRIRSCNRAFDEAAGTSPEEGALAAGAEHDEAQGHPGVTPFTRPWAAATFGYQEYRF